MDLHPLDPGQPCCSARSPSPTPGCSAGPPTTSCCPAFETGDVGWSGLRHGRSPCSSAWRSCGRSASSPAASAPASCSTGCRPTTAATSPGSTSGCRWSGTSGTPPASCSPTPTPTSRPPGRRSRRCRWRSGTVAMMVIAVVQMLLTDLVLALVGLLVFPLGDPRQRGLPAVPVAADDPRAGAARRGSARSRTSPSTARWSSRRWAARPRRPSGSRARPTSCATPTSGPAGSARSSTRCSRRCPNLGVLAVLAVGVPAGRAPGRPTPGDVVTIAYLLTIVAFPIRSLGWLLGEFPRSVVGFDRVAGGARRPPARWSTARRVGRDARTAGARLEVDRPRLPLRRGPGRCSTDVTFTVDARPDRRRRRRDRLGQEHADLPAVPAGRPRPRARPRRRHRPARPGRRARWPSTSRWCRSRRSSSTTPSAATSTLGADVTDDEVWEALRTAQADGFVAALPDGLDTRLGERGTTLSGGQRQRLSLARALVGRPRLLVMDDATSAVDPEVEARILAALRAAGATRTRPSSWSPTARPRSRSPTRWSSSRRPGRRPGPARRAARPQPRLRRPGQRLRAPSTADEQVADATEVGAMSTADARPSGHRARQRRGASAPGRPSAAASSCHRSCARGSAARSLFAVAGHAGRVVVPDRGPAGPRPRAQRAAAAPTSASSGWIAALAALSASCSPASRPYLMTARLFPPPRAAWRRCGSRRSGTCTTCRC